MTDRGTGAVLGALRQAFPDGRLVTDVEERYRHLKHSLDPNRILNPGKIFGLSC